MCARKASDSDASDKYASALVKFSHFSMQQFSLVGDCPSSYSAARMLAERPIYSGGTRCTRGYWLLRRLLRLRGSSAARYTPTMAAPAGRWWVEGWWAAQL